MSSKRRLPLWVWIVGTPLALWALAWAALAILLPPARARQLVREQLSRSLAREVRFRDVALSLFPPVRLSVKGLELAEPGGLAKGAAFSAASVDLDLDVLALLTRRVRVRRLSLESPTLHLLLRADGSTNFDGVGAAPKPAAKAAPPLDLAVEELRIRNGGVLVDDLRAARRVSLGVETRTSLSAEQGGARVATEGHTVLTRLAFGPLTAARASDLDQGLAKLVWRIEHRGKYDAPTHRLALETLALDLGDTRLALSGLVDGVGPRPLVDLRARGDNVDLAEVLSWVAVADARAVKGLTGSGHVAFDVGLRGRLAAGQPPALLGALTVRDAAFRYAGADAEVTGLSFTANFRPDSLVIADASATVSGQPVAARLLVWRFADPMVDFVVRGNVDLAAVGPMAAPPGTKLAGHAAVNLSGRGVAKDPGTLALGGSAELHDVSVEGAGLPKRVEQVNGRLEFSPARAAVHQLSAHAGQSSYVLDATVERPLALLSPPGKVPPANVEFAFRSPYLDLAELLPTTPGAPFLPNASGSGRVIVDRLKQGRLDVSAVTADIRLTPAALDAWRFAMKGYGGTVTGDAKFDLHDTRKPSYALHAVVDSVKTDAILGAWTPMKDLLAGTLGTKLEFSGAGQTPDDVKRSLTLVGLAAITDGRLGPGPALEALAQFVRVPKLKQVDFARLELPMRIEHGRVVTDPVVLSGPSGEWKLAGAMGFDGALDYAVSVTLPPSVADALGARSALAAGALADPQGRMLLDLHVSGSARSPRVAWDTNAMRARLAGRASEALAEQRSKLEADAKEAARQALLEKLSGQRDSTVAHTSLGAEATRDSVRNAAKNLLKNFFGRGKSESPATVADTTRH